MGLETGTWKDLKDAKEQLGLGEPPPSGLVPIGDTGLYTTPDTPADPRDCDRYPDSPFCGGNPFSQAPIGLDISTTVQANPCGITRSVTVSPTLGFVKLPPVTAAYIPENCREEYEKQGRDEPPPPPPGERDDYEPTPQYRPYGYDVDAVVCVVTIDQYYEENRDYFPDSGWCTDVSILGGATSSIKYPSGKKVNYYNQAKNGSQLIDAKASIEGIAYGSSYLNSNYVRRYFRGEGSRTANDSVPIAVWIEPDRPKQREFFSYNRGHDYQFNYYYTTLYPSVYQVAVWIGRLGDIFPNKQISPIQNSFTKTVQSPLVYTKRVVHERFVVYCEKISGDASDRRPPPLPPPKKHCCEDNMGCCQPSYGNQQQQDNNRILQLLRRIDQKIGNYPLQVTVFDENEDKRGAEHKNHTLSSMAEGIKLAIERNEKLAKILGIDLLPITVPKTVIEKKGEGIFEKVFGFLDFNKNEEINSILEMQTWMFHQMSGILGHWMMEIEVEDADPTKAGNQKEHVILPNMAMTMREQVAMQIQSLKALGLLVDMQIKTLIDLAGTKVLSAECAARLEDLQIYLDYETEEVTEPLTVQVTMPSLNAKREEIENLANFLEKGEIQVSYDRWVVKKSQSLEEKLIQLLEMSSAIRALYFHGGA